MMISTDVGDLAQDIRRLFEDLARRRPDRSRMVPGECLPLFDIFETDRTIEIVLDLPGVSASSVRIVLKGGVVLVVGEKERLDTRGPASLHLVERDFGRFARAVRVHAAIEASAVVARLKDGELRIILPKITERRGREIPVQLQSEAEPSTDKR